MSASPSPKDRQLSAVFVALADSLVTDYDVVDLMHQLTTTCVNVLNCDAAGLLLADPEGHLRMMASSSEKMRLLELLELQNSDGPCLECFNSGKAVAVTSLDNAQVRWPYFAPAARAAGFTSVQALPLRLREDTIGALNLFFTDANAMTEDETVVAQALADVATIGILQQRALHEREVVSEQLQRALTNRLVIEQAKGVLAERAGISIDEAFDVLRDYCRARRIATSRVAHEITTGALDPSVVIRYRSRRA